MNYSDWETKAAMRKDELSYLRKHLGDKFEDKLDRCRRNIALNTPQLLEVCKTCRHFSELGNVANYGVVSPSMGCLELGIRVNELWHCGKWSPKPSMMVTLDNLKIDEDIVTEAAYIEDRLAKKDEGSD